MAKLLKEALKKAFAKAGKEIAGKYPGGKHSAKPVTNAVSSGSTIKVRDAGQSTHRVDASAKSLNGPAKHGSPNTEASKVGKGMPVAIVKPPPAAPDYVLQVEAENLACRFSDEPDEYAYAMPESTGISEQAHAGNWADEREVTVGLDFGTSSAKVIIGDSVLERAFAVPFSASDGIQQYLLPSRLYETGTRFSLGQGEQVYRDLKLALLADPGNEEWQIRVVAFLALTIRHARGWLLSKHQDVYRATNIAWKLMVGLPAAHHFDGRQQEVFTKLCQAAWLAASSPGGSIDRPTVKAAISRANQLASGAEQVGRYEEVEIGVLPEIAAQIYGFVRSNRFNSNDKNLFLMVDIGAGTADSSLFHIKQDRGSKYGFTFYATQVQPNGVMNLHRHRVQWWEQALTTLDAKLKPDAFCLKDGKFPTDRMRSIPESFKDYFSGITVKYRSGKEDPDQHFFKHVLAQVRGQTMWRTWKDGFLTQADLSGIPMFLCGGGTRMQFYRNLENEMPNMPGYTWLYAQVRPLEVPRILDAPGLPRQEYDRLSVAFGLSFLEVSKVVKGTPIPPVEPLPVKNWQANYIDKDQC